VNAFNDSGKTDLSIHFGDFLATIGTWTMPALTDSVNLARVNVSQNLELEEKIDVHQVIAVLSELVANSILHATTELQVSLERWQYMIKIVVADANDQPPVMRSLDVAVDCGRGMHIVDQYSDLWGYEITDQGKRIWAGFISN
jgi:anti-sigma regulatory factor (Ser/Thr protein kinase)